VLVNFVFSSAVDTIHTVTTTVCGDQSERRERFLAGVVSTRRTDGRIYKKVAVCCMQKKQSETLFYGSAGDVSAASPDPKLACIFYLYRLFCSDDR
jgi:hypothetical protein